MRTFLYVNFLFILLTMGCGGDDEKKTVTEEDLATTCSDACVIMAECAGQTPAQCEEKCGIFTSTQLQCVAGTSTCPAAEACLTSDENNSTQNNSTQNNSTADCSSSLGACEADEICVRKSSVYECVQTNLQSCNENAFPDICDCLFPSFGEVPPEAVALCSSAGISGCTLTGGRLSVDCQ